MNMTIAAAAPEEMGIPSSSITSLIRRLEETQVPLHSFCIARHGKLVYEGYYAPYEANTLHRMFSVTKSLVSLGIGCLESEGKLDLDDPICRYFPEYVPDVPLNAGGGASHGFPLDAGEGASHGSISPWLAEMTIRHMLQMKTCHSKTTYNKHSTTENWVESFFTTPPSHKPGTIFMYDTSASHVLCALVEKLSEKKLLDYLRERFLDRIGFSREAYILPDPFGTSMGGSGLMALPADLLRLGLLIMNHGKDPFRYGDPEADSLYPASYLDLATACHGHTVMNAPIEEEGLGYGYQFWQLSHNGFSCYGMGGQLLLCYPKYDLVIVTTADTQDIKGGNQLIYQAIYDELFPQLSSAALPGNPAAFQALENGKKELSLPILKGMMSSPEAAGFLHPAYQLDNNPAGFRTLSITPVTDRIWTLGLSYHKIDSHDQSVGHGGEYRYDFGFGHLVEGTMAPYDQHYAASACWLDDCTLYIRFWLMDECTASIHIQLYFTKRTVTVSMKNTEETKFGEFQGFLNGVVQHRVSFAL